MRGGREMTAEELQWIARVWGVHIRRAVRVAGGFSGAGVWKVETDQSQCFAVRRTELVDESEWIRRNAICRWMSLVGDCGVTCVPVPLKPMRDSGDAEALSNRCQDYLVRGLGGVWQLEPWMPGEFIAGLPSDAELTATMRVLEQIHRLGREAGQRGDLTSVLAVRRGVSPGVERRLRIVMELQAGLLTGLEAGANRDPDRRFGPAAERMCVCLRSGLRRLQTLLSAAVSEEVALQPVLRDLWRPHVLFHEGRISGVIDWNAAATDHVVLDLTRLMRSWYGAHHKDLWRVYRDISEVRRFGSAEFRLLRACDAASVLLSPVTWLRRRYSQEVAGSAEESVVVRFEELVTTAESFVASSLF